MASEEDDEPVRDSNETEHRRNLLAEYNDLVNDAGSTEDIGDQLAEFIVRIMGSLGFGARRSRPGVISGTRTIALPLPSGHYLLEVTGQPDEPTTMDQVAAVRAEATRRTGLRSILLSISGFTKDARAAGEEGVTTVILMDRPHLEAIVCGLVSPDFLFDTLAQHALFGEIPYTSLTELLLDRPLEATPACTTPDRLPPPWPLVEEVADGVRVRQLIAGRYGWPDVLGAALVDDQRLVVTTDLGLAEIHLKRATVDWLLPLPGCRGAPLVKPDGTIIVLCGEAVVEWRDGSINLLGGGLGDAVCLVVGPAHEAWALSGVSGHGDGDGTLALTRLGSSAGQQQSYNVSFNANVRGTVWLGDRRFYLAAGGHSAVVDLARSSAVRSADLVPTSQSYPSHLLVADDRTVLSVSASKEGVGTSFYVMDPVHRTDRLIAKLAFNAPQAMASGPDGAIYLVGDVRGNDVHQPRLVIVRVTLPVIKRNDGQQHKAKTDRDSDPYFQVRVGAHGFKKDYSIDPKPIARGGQATVIGARHKSSNISVAFKRLTSRTEESVARMRREIEAGHLFGDNPPRRSGSRLRLGL